MQIGHATSQYWISQLCFGQLERLHSFVLVYKDQVLPLDHFYNSKVLGLQELNQIPSSIPLAVVLHCQSPDLDFVERNRLEDIQLGSFHVQTEVVNDGVV